MPLQIKAIMMTLTSVVPYLFTFYGYSLLMQTFSDFFRKRCVMLFHIWKDCEFESRPTYYGNATSDLLYY